jgi:hypothetical protein
MEASAIVSTFLFLPLRATRAVRRVIAKSSSIVETFLSYARDMTIRRMDNTVG